MKCLSELPFTGFELHADNPVEKLFWGRAPIANAMGMLYFTKDSAIQHLIHQLKYNGKKEIGHFMGMIMGQKILSSNRFAGIDAIVPLPLFKLKEKKRGYNQSSVLCDGIAETLHAPVLKNIVVRTMATDTQTHKTRIERWQNIEGKFQATDLEKIKNMHLLLVDDIVTTGATLEACAMELMKAQYAKISIAALAYTLI